MVVSFRTVPLVQMIEIGGTLGSDVNLGQETGGGNLACLGTGECFQMLLFQNLAVCFYLVAVFSDMLVLPRHSVMSTVMIE